MLDALLRDLTLVVNGLTICFEPPATLLEEQRIDAVFGNLALDRPGLRRETVRAALQKSVSATS